MPRYETEVLVQFELDGDEEAAYEKVASIMQQHHVQTGATLGWDYEMLDGCVKNVSEEEDSLAQATATTCKHCGREIVHNPTDGWVCPEAGFDSDGDGIWRETCEENRTDFSAPHEPVELCKECLMSPAEEHGMCGPCLHDAYRSGWQPGSTD